MPTVSIIRDRPSAIKPHATYCYIDTIELWFRYPPTEYAKVRKMQDGRAILEPCRDDAGFTWGYRMIVHQPKRSTISMLDHLQQKYKAPICRLDVAADFILGSDQERQTVRAWLERNVLLRWRPAGPMFDEGDTTGWVEYRDRKRLGKKRANRDLELYADKECKLTGEVDCVHLELRFLTSAAVRAAGYGRATSVPKLNPRRLFRKHVKLVNFDPDTFKQRAMRSAVNEDRRFYRRRTTTPFDDRYRASIPRRIKAFIERWTLDRAQLVKDHFGIKMKSVDLDVLHIPDRLEWPVSHDNIIPPRIRPKFRSDLNGA